jgi:predicted RNA-binding protein YlqC (UPF0109 family)
MSETAQPTTESGATDCDPMEDWEILTEVLLALVSRPAAVRVEQRTLPDATCFVIHTAPEDLGKVIGKNGETVTLIRKLFGRIAAARGRKVFIEVNEPARLRRARPVGSRRNAAA